MVAQGQILVQPQGLPGGLERYVRIAFPVAPDARAEPEERRHDERHTRRVCGQGPPKVAVQLGQYLPEDLVEVDETVSDLILHRGRAKPDLIALPSGRDLREDFRLQILLLAEREERVIQAG